MRRDIRQRGLVGLGVCAVVAASSCAVPPPVDPLPTADAGTAQQLGDGTIGSLAAAANDDAIQSPFDATPSPDGSLVYFTALTRSVDGLVDVPGIFRVSAEGGDPETIAVGDPLAAPVNISVRLDGSALIIADAAAFDDDETGEGALLTVPVSAGTPTLINGTRGYAPHGLTVALVDDEERVYFTGTSPDTEEPGLFYVAPTGGVVTTVAKGAPFASPGGVTVNAAGVAFVVDALGSDDLAALLRVENGEVSLLQGRIGVGYPAGVTLSRDESRLLVSGLDPVTRRDLVYRLTLADGTLETMNTGIADFSEPAGLHRAHDAEVYAWADSEANATGTVYVLTP